MADLTRLWLHTIAENVGWTSGTKMTHPLRIALRSALLKALRTPDGKRALADAPRVHYAERGEDKYRQMDEQAAANALLEEFEGA